VTCSFFEENLGCQRDAEDERNLATSLEFRDSYDSPYYRAMRNHFEYLQARTPAALGLGSPVGYLWFGAQAIASEAVHAQFRTAKA
jgi:hypothetical protein